MTAVAQEISDRGALTGFQMYTKTLLQQPMAREGTPRPGRAHRVPIYTRTLLQQPKAREDSSRGRADGRGRVVTGPLSKAATVDRSLLRCNPFFDCQYQLETAFVELTMAGAAVRLPTKSPSRVLTQGDLPAGMQSDPRVHLRSAKPHSPHAKLHVKGSTFR